MCRLPIRKLFPGMSMSNLPYQPDVMVMESTYGNKQHEDRAEEERRLVLDIAKVIDAGGKVLIPAFAIGRAQEVILILKHAMQSEEIRPFPVWVDGMVRDINRVYSDNSSELSPLLKRKAQRCDGLFYSDAVRKVSSPDDRDNILTGPRCCIVASSGMLIGGSSSNYAKHLAPHSENLIAITGYQAEGTPGRALEDLAKSEVSDERVWKLNDGTPVPVQCQVPERYSLTAHADGGQLTTIVEKVQPRRLFLVHGDGEARHKLAKSVQEKCPSVDVELPKNGETYTVKHHPGIAGKRKLPHDRILSELYCFLAKNTIKGPFSARELAEIWFGTKAMTLERLACFRLFLCLKLGRFVGDSDLFNPKELV